MHILASGPELKAVRFGYVLGEKLWKKGSDPEDVLRLGLWFGKGLKTTRCFHQLSSSILTAC